MPVRIKRLHPDAIVPTYATRNSAGMDLHSVEDVSISSQDGGLIATGWAMEIPPGYEGQIRPRSGLAVKHGVTVLNSPGTIDADYRGEVKVLLINHGPRTVKIQKGDRIAQLVICPVQAAVLTEVDELSDTNRGSGGFGSTGR